MRISTVAALLFIFPALGVIVNASGQTPQLNNCEKESAAAHYTPVKSIDFSSKHDIMIKSEDGTLTPMDVPYYKSKQIAPGTWQIESDGDFSYLLEGENEALSIDTGYGAGNIRAYLQTLTKKPVRFVANTHEHFDHTANDAYFDCAYMSAETAERATIPFHSFAGINFPRNYPKVIVKDGYKIELGHREVEVFIIPNHTPGGTAYLDKREHILFGGDEIFPGTTAIRTWGSVAQYERNMSKLEARRSEFNQVATGGYGLIDATWVDKFLANTKYILAGHEGVQATQQQGPAPLADPSAAVIYNRRSPRPGDSADPVSSQPARPSEDMRTMTYDGCSLTYDIHHIQN